MEILRPDFLFYIAAIRKSLAAIQTELDSEKSIDEIDCIDRMLRLFEAEHSYRAEHFADMQSELTAVVDLLTPILEIDTLHDLAAELMHWQTTAWQTPDARTAAQRSL
ncbi:MAG: hypothetical protein ABW049_13435, partial [Spongiibacteraceae bacterium]